MMQGLEDLAPFASFEEVAYLLLHGRLPDPSEGAEFTEDLASRRALPQPAMALLEEAAAVEAPPIDVLRMAAPLLGLGRAEDARQDAITSIACFPTIVGAYWRIRNGEAPVPVRCDLGHTAYYLHQLSGVEPPPERARALERT